jgi:dCMP deaminase
MKPKFIEAHMQAAENYSKLSSAKRLQVGCVIVKDDTIIGIGYNGMPAGWTNECEKKVYADETNFDSEDWTFTEEDSGLLLKYNTVTKDEVLHAETNAITKVAKSTNSTDGAEMFVTHAPCLDCAKLIHQSGIKKLFYRDTYKNDDGLKFLKLCSVEVEHIKLNNQ